MIWCSVCLLSSLAHFGSLARSEFDSWAGSEHGFAPVQIGPIEPTTIPTTKAVFVPSQHYTAVRVQKAAHHAAFHSRIDSGNWSLSREWAATCSKEFPGTLQAYLIRVLKLTRLLREILLQSDDLPPGGIPRKLYPNPYACLRAVFPRNYTPETSWPDPWELIDEDLKDAFDWRNADSLPGVIESEYSLNESVLRLNTYVEVDHRESQARAEIVVRLLLLIAVRCSNLYILQHQGLETEFFKASDPLLDFTWFDLPCWAGPITHWFRNVEISALHAGGRVGGKTSASFSGALSEGRKMELLAIPQSVVTRVLFHAEEAGMVISGTLPIASIRL